MRNWSRRGQNIGSTAAAKFAVQFALMAVAALLYFGVRSLTEGNPQKAVSNGFDVLHAERVIGIDIEASAQNVVLGSRWLTTASNWVYIWGHWPTIIITLIWLYRRHRRRYFLLRNAMFVSGAIGLVIFAAYPVAPPRLLPGEFVDTVTDLSRSYRVLQPPALVNKYAAMPSLHAGWNLIVGIVIVCTSRRRVVQALGCVGPALMAVAVVTTANHYVLDVLVGCAVGSIGLVVSHLLWQPLYGDRSTSSEVGRELLMVVDESVDGHASA